MKKSKSLTALLLAFVLLLGLLAGCGSSSDSTTDSADEAEEAEETEEVETETADDGATYSLPIVDEPITYTMWITYAPFSADLIDVETMSGILVLDELQEVTNIYFDFTPVNGAADEDNFNLMIASGDYCDILSCMEYYNTGLEGAVEEGIIMDLADILPEYCPTYWDYLTSDTTSLMTAYTESGYMPAILVLMPELGQEAIGPLLRADWLEEFGMDMPTTFDELFDYLEMAYTEKGAIFEMTATDGIYGDLAYGLNIDIGGYTVVDGEVIYGQATDEFKEYLIFMNELYENGLISQDFFSTTNEDLSSQARQDFGSGTNSLVSVSASNSSDIVMNVTEDSFEMAVLPYVSSDGTTEAHVGPESLVSLVKDTDPWCFNAELSLEDIEPLLEMVEFLFSDEGYMLTNYGVEGETYTIDEDGNPQYTDLVINNPDGLSYFFASYVYATNSASGFFPYINDMSRTFYDFNDNQWEIYEDLKNLSDCAYNYPTYADLTTDEAATYSSIESDLTTYSESMILAFIVGNTDIEAEYDTYVETLYSMGLQTMIDLKQDAYDRSQERLAEYQ